jgi:hypothetical protein
VLGFDLRHLLYHPLLPLLLLLLLLLLLDPK